jgi:hypothetical protein
VPAIDAAPAPDATPGRPDPAAVRAVFLRLQEGVRACADKEGPGAFHVSATVRGSDGRASRVDVRTGLSAGARDCVRDLVLATQFPTFGDEDASFLHSFDVPGPATADGGAADAGADAAVPTAQDVEHRLRRARREALGCTEGVTGHVRLTVHIDGRAQRATLVGVDGDVTDEQRECLRRVVEATEVPALPGEMTVPMVLQ